MELAPPRQGGGVEAKTSARLSGLDAYLAVIFVLGLAALFVAAYATPWVSTFDEVLFFPSLFLAAAAIAGELRPITLVRGSAEPRTLSTSAPFVIALVAVTGIGVAVFVQALASMADDIIRGRSPKKSLFNTAQYAISVFGAGAVYSWLADVPFFGVPTPVEPGDIGPLLAAGIAMIGLNWVLVAGVVALSTAHPLVAVLRADVREFFFTLVVLLSAGGIAAAVAGDGVAPLVLLAVVVVAAHIFAAAAAKHAHDASHDLLTGLGHRGLADYELKRALDSGDQDGSSGPGLIFMDIDHFKDFNDTLGHPVGDRILREVADRLVAAAPDQASVHRLGGDEFAVVVCGGEDVCRQAADDLLASLDTPIEIENLELLVRISAGVAVAPMHGTDSETLMKNSDIALYHAKLERDRISVYEPEFDVNTVARLRLMADLRAALDSRTLTVVYQPQVDLGTRATAAVEALVRWEHPDLGPMAPDEFIPLAENSGLIFPLTAFVLDTALAQLAQWREAGHDLRMAVNLSARHLSDLGLPGQVSRAAAKHGVPLNALVLEVTETGILSDPVRADVVIHALRELGVEIAIDDYGTGNASLSYLKRLEIDELKIDRSFVSNIGTHNQDLIIVRSTIALALDLGLRVVAEGIEDEATTQSLHALGQVIGQGYHLGYPVPPEEIQTRLEAERQMPLMGTGKA